MECQGAFILCLLVPGIGQKHFTSEYIINEWPAFRSNAELLEPVRHVVGAIGVAFMPELSVTASVAGGDTKEYVSYRTRSGQERKLSWKNRA